MTMRTPPPCDACMSIAILQDSFSPLCHILSYLVISCQANERKKGPVTISCGDFFSFLYFVEKKINKVVYIRIYCIY